MSIFKEPSSKKIDMVFILMLITLFAATSLALVLIGAKHYRNVTDTMTRNHQLRTTSSYLAEKIRQNDAEDAITVCDLMGVNALSIKTTTEDAEYITYIYYYDNALRELVVTNSSVFSLSTGQEIIPLEEFNISLLSDSLIRAEITDIAGTSQTLYFSLHCNSLNNNALHSDIVRSREGKENL